MPISQQEYDSLAPEKQAEYDASERAREAAQQAALPYRWSQALDHLVLSIDVPEGTRGKDLVVEIKKRKFKVAFKGKDPICQGEFSKDIKEDESTWSLEDNKILNIHLEKMNTSDWWAHVLTTDPKIDTTKLVPENSKLSDLDGETRGMVEKMMFDNRQKQMGKPTSDQLQQQEMLAKLQKANPEMDFSGAKFS